MLNPKAMTFGILIFPGAHGDKELSRVLSEEYARDFRYILPEERDLSGIDVLVIPGGFPCKGSSCFPKCNEAHPVLQEMIAYAERGKILIGIGNGFRVLCESGLVPGTLRMNQSQRYICTNTFIKAENENTALTRHLPSDTPLRIPIATGYGRYTAKEEELVQMRLQDQILFRYCDHAGSISEEINLTGAVDNIAGVCNEKKNVFGLIPQPERAIFHGPYPDGKAIFDSLLAYLS